MQPWARGVDSPVDRSSSRPLRFGGQPLGLLFLLVVHSIAVQLVVASPMALAAAGGVLAFIRSSAGDSAMNSSFPNAIYLTPPGVLVYPRVPGDRFVQVVGEHCIVGLTAGHDIIPIYGCVAAYDACRASPFFALPHVTLAPFNLRNSPTASLCSLVANGAIACLSMEREANGTVSCIERVKTQPGMFSSLVSSSLFWQGGARVVCAVVSGGSSARCWDLGRPFADRNDVSDGFTEVTTLVTPGRIIKVSLGNRRLMILTSAGRVEAHYSYPASRWNVIYASLSTWLLSMSNVVAMSGNHHQHNTVCVILGTGDLECSAGIPPTLLPVRERKAVLLQDPAFGNELENWVDVQCDRFTVVVLSDTGRIVVVEGQDTGITMPLVVSDPFVAACAYPDYGCGLDDTGTMSCWGNHEEDPFPEHRFSELACSLWGVAGIDRSPPHRIRTPEQVQSVFRNDVEYVNVSALIDGPLCAQVRSNGSFWCTASRWNELRPQVSEWKQFYEVAFHGVGAALCRGTSEGWWECVGGVDYLLGRSMQPLLVPDRRAFYVQGSGSVHATPTFANTTEQHFTSISGGGLTLCAIGKLTKRIICMPHYRYLHTPDMLRHLPTALSFVSVVGTFSARSVYCALSTEGSVFCFGESPKVIVDAPPFGLIFTSIHTSGHQAFCGVLAEDSDLRILGVQAPSRNVYCWGPNIVAQTYPRGVFRGVSLGAPANHYRVGGQPAEPCPPGTYSSGPGAQSALCSGLCQTGTDGGIGGAAAASSSSAGWSNSEACGGPCKEGSYCETQERQWNMTARPCQAGTVQPFAGSTSCNACPSGRISPHVGGTECASCPPGKFGNGTGVSSCTDCDRGSFSDLFGGGGCFACPPGRVSNRSRSSECTACPSGKSARLFGLTTCVACTPGTYAPVDALSECLSCVQNTVAPISGADACAACPLNAESTRTRTSCVCSAGFFAVKHSDRRLLNNTALAEAYDATTAVSAAFAASFVCLPCPENADCSEAGTARETLLPQRGFAPDARGFNVRFFACDEPEVCDVATFRATTPHNSSCPVGHAMPLCAVCAPGYAFGATSPKFCGPCVDSAALAGQFIGGVLAVTGLLSGLVIANVRGFNDDAKPYSVLIKVFLNSVQVNSFAASLDFEWPSSVRGYFSVQDAYVAASSVTLSLDCLMQGDDGSHPRIAPVYVAVILQSVAPFIAALFISLACLAYKLWWSRKSAQLLLNEARTEQAEIERMSKASEVDTGVVRRLTETERDEILADDGGATLSAVTQRRTRYLWEAALITVCFMLHGSIAKSVLRLFSCREVDTSGKTYLRDDLREQCWSGTHLTMVLLVSLPTLFAFVIGIPAVALFRLRQHRNTLHLPSVKLRYAFMQKGYRPEAYLWEITAIARKIAIVFIGVVFRGDGHTQSLAVVFVLVVATVAQIVHRPYSSDLLNGWELYSLMNALGVFWLAQFLFVDSASARVRETFSVIIVLALVVHAFVFVVLFFMVTRGIASQFVKHRVLRKGAVARGDQDVELAAAARSADEDAAAGVAGERGRARLLSVALVTDDAPPAAAAGAAGEGDGRRAMFHAATAGKDVTEEEEVEEEEEEEEEQEDDDDDNEEKGEEEEDEVKEENARRKRIFAAARERAATLLKEAPGSGGDDDDNVEEASSSDDGLSDGSALAKEDA